MLNKGRRNFLQALGFGTAAAHLAACGAAADGERAAATESLRDDGDFVILYDTYAVAMYFDGSIGPTTGIVTVQEIVNGVDAPKTFWHGHGGVDHRYVVRASDLAQLHQKKKVFLQTDVVAEHSHRLFVDPTDARWRVPGAKPVKVPRRPGASSK